MQSRQNSSNASAYVQPALKTVTAPTAVEEYTATQSHRLISREVGPVDLQRSIGDFDVLRVARVEFAIERDRCHAIHFAERRRRQGLFARRTSE